MDLRTDIPTIHTRVLAAELEGVQHRIVVHHLDGMPAVYYLQRHNGDGWTDAVLLERVSKGHA
jgi:hypothetical protein